MTFTPETYRQGKWYSLQIEAMHYGCSTLIWLADTTLMAERLELLPYIQRYKTWLNAEI